MICMSNYEQALNKMQNPRQGVELITTIHRFFCAKIYGHKVDINISDNSHFVCKRCGASTRNYNEFYRPNLYELPKLLRIFVVCLYFDFRDKTNGKDGLYI